MSERHNHAENFSLKSILSLSGIGLDERMAKFAEFTELIGLNKVNLYERKIYGSMNRTAKVEDPITKKVQEMLMFGSNNYLNLTTHPKVINSVQQVVGEFGAGVSGPPLLNGTSILHSQLRTKLSEFKKVDDILILSSGYMANLAWTASLIQKEDIIFFDEFNHASFYDGLKFSQGKKVSFKHSDMRDLAAKLEESKGQGCERWIVVEGVYSMDGDLAPLPDVVELAKKYNCRVIVDDAHGTGVLGETGSGTVEHFKLDPKDITLHYGTFSKTFGSVGGFLGGSQQLINYIRFVARPHMFSAALPHSVIQTVLAGIEVIQTEPERRVQLHKNVQQFISGLKEIGINTSSESGIVPIIIQGEGDVRPIAFKFQQAGIFLNSVEYPAVPRDKQRLRISFTANHTADDVNALLRVCEQILKNK